MSLGSAIVLLHMFVQTASGKPSLTVCPQLPVKNLASQLPHCHLCDGTASGLSCTELRIQDGHMLCAGCRPWSTTRSRQSESCGACWMVPGMGHLMLTTAGPGPLR